MAPSAAAADQAFRGRHQEHWPRNLFVYDAQSSDETARRTLMLEAPRGELVLAAEYVGADEGPQSLSDPRFHEAVAVASDRHPAFAVQYTHPLMNPPQSWAFRLWPLNSMASAIGAVELTEQRYVQLLYVLQAGALDAGGMVEQSTATIRFAPWKELAHLDDSWPAPDAWPAVQEANISSGVGTALKSLIAARTFLEQLGQPLTSGSLAPVDQLIMRRPTIGSYRQTAVSPVDAPIELSPTRAHRDRWDRLRWDLDRRYRKMWASEAPSDDNRDMWRAWDADGTPRWQASPGA